LNALDKAEEVEKKEFFVALYWLEKKLLKIWLFDRIGQETKKIEIPENVIQLADKRLQAKKEKNFAVADELRNKIQDAWYRMQDAKDGYEIEKI
jgi:cysteinyl-tRNA synthetase